MRKHMLLVRLLSLILMSIVASFSAVQADVGGTQATPLVSQLFQVFGALLFIILLILGAAWLAKNLKINGGASGQKITALSVLPLGRKEKVILIESCGEKILLGVTASAVNAIHVFDKTKESELVDNHAIRAVIEEKEPQPHADGKHKFIDDGESKQVEHDHTKKAKVEFSNFLKAVMSGKKSEN